MRKKVSTGGKIFIAAGLIIIAAVAQYVIFNVIGVAGNRGLVMTDTGVKVEYGLGTDARFHSFDSDNFYFCTKDGMQYISSSGTLVWSGIYSLSNPIMSTAGEMVAVGDAKGRHIYVFDSEGAAYDVAFDYPVLTFSINRTGMLSAILQQDKGYAVYVYNRRNYAAPVARYVFQDELMPPVSSDVSDDGRVAVIGFWNLNVGYSSRVSFYFINETDARDTEDGMFASRDYENVFVHTVRFADGGRALSFSDTEVTGFLLGEGNTCTEEWTIPFHNEVDLLDIYAGKRFAVALGDKFLNDEEASEPGVVNIYNIDGTLSGTFSLGRSATSLSIGKGGVLVGADRGYYALGFAGTVLWDYRAVTDIREMRFLDDTNTVLMAGTGEVSVWKREREKSRPPLPPEEIIQEETVPEEPVTEEMTPEENIKTTPQPPVVENRESEVNEFELD